MPETPPRKWSSSRPPNDSAGLFCDPVRAAMRPEACSTGIKVTDSLALNGHVGPVLIEGMGWAEVFLNNIEIATGSTDTWEP